MRSILRSETQELHGKLDSAVGGTDPFSSCDAYRTYLECMRQLYLTYQLPLDQASELFSMPCHGRETIECLDLDIRWLATQLVSPNDGSAIGEASPVATDSVHEPVQSESRSVGIAYTLEGSAMGASYMNKIVRDKAEFSGATAFLTKLSGDARERWPVFRDHLELYQGEVAEAVTGARDVFGKAMSLFQNS